MTSNTLREQIQNAIKSAMLSGEKQKRDTLRLILAAIKQREVDERIVLQNQLLNDEQVLSVLEKMIKQRRESAIQYTAGNRPDLAEKENTEIQIVQTFLPPQLSDAEINTLTFLICFPAVIAFALACICGRPSESGVSEVRLKL